ncbi:MAG: translation initiation factor IF-2 [archaeon]
MPDERKLRQPICCVVGHVDHGKTKLLDKIRGSATQAAEAGGITQAIGASIIPLNTIKKICGSLLNSGVKFTIPGLLFIDTPGHAAFTNLRKRGGNLADIAILIVDINEGFMPQTIESVEILKSFKTPFIVAANKIDLIPGYRESDKKLIDNINSQDPGFQERIETKLYEIVGKLSELGIESERFDRITDYTKQAAIVPVSAKTGDGIPELLMVLVGLAQKYLENNIRLNIGDNAKGSILEIKETQGLGKTMDVIIYDGILRRGDTILIGGVDGPIETKIKALLLPADCCDMRDKKSKFCGVNEVIAATGVKISAQDIDNVIAGMPIRSVSKANYESVKEELNKEVNAALIETDKNGIIIKADTLGSLEALTILLKEKNIMVRKAAIGAISKKDIADAESNFDKDPLTSVILGFNVSRDDGVASTEKVKIITNNIIYKIIEEYEQWLIQTKNIMEARELDSLVRPCKILLLDKYIFRQNNPAIIGGEILEGKVKTGTKLMLKGKTITTLKSMQEEKDSVTTATKGKQIALALDGITIGRQIQGVEILYSYIPEEDFKKIKKLTKYLSHGEIEVLKETASQMRNDNPVWGV